MHGIREGDLVRYVGLADAGVGDGAPDAVTEDLGVGVAGVQTPNGRVVDFSDTVGLLCCVDEELVPAPEEWTPARAVDLLVCGFAPDRVAELTGYDQRWMTGLHGRLTRQWRAEAAGESAARPAAAAQPAAQPAATRDPADEPA